MFISNIHNCSFEINYAKCNIHQKTPFSIQNASYDELFGYLLFVDDYVKDSINYYKSFVWRRLLNETLHDRKTRHNLQVYNPYTLREDVPIDNRIDDDDLFEQFSEEEDAEKEDDTQNEKRLAITRYLQRLQPFYLFLKTVYGVSPRTWLEPQQRAFIFQSLLFKVKADEGMTSLERFILAMTQDFLGFRPYSLNFVTRVVPKNYSISLLQRGMGKTTVQKDYAAAAMLCYVNVKVFMLAQTKTMVQTTVVQIRHILQKYNDPSKNLLRVPNNGLRIYMNYTGSDIEKANSDKYVPVHSGSYSYYNDLVYMSGKNADSVRGQDPHIVIVDEFMSVPASTHGSVLPLGQRKHCQINYLSSPVFNKPEMFLNILVDLKQQHNINLYRTTFFCTNKLHQKHISAQPACVNLMLYLPPYVTYSDENKLITDVMTYECDGKRGVNETPYYAAPYTSLNSSSAYHNEIGIVKRADLINAMKSRDASYYENTGNCFDKCFYDYLKTEKAYVDPKSYNYSRKQRIMIDGILPKTQSHAVNIMENRINNKKIEDHIDFFIYIDPGYNAYTLSGIGICCTTKPLHREDRENPNVDSRRQIVTYMNHRFLDEHDLANVPELIRDIVWSCIQCHQKMFPRNKLLNFFIAVENNSNQAITAQIYDRLSSLYARTGLKEGYVMYLYHSLKKGRRMMGYSLGIEKTAFFSTIITMSNNHLISFARQIERNIHPENSTYRQRRLTTVTGTIMSHFETECLHFTYSNRKRGFSGKLIKQGTTSGGINCDDTVTSYGMSNILCRSHSERTLQYKTSTPCYPWIRVRLRCANQYENKGESGSEEDESCEETDDGGGSSMDDEENDDNL